jgi:hypothetical protein
MTIFSPEKPKPDFFDLKCLEWEVNGNEPDGFQGCTRGEYRMQETEVRRMKSTRLD